MIRYAIGLFVAGAAALGAAGCSGSDMPGMDHGNTGNPASSSTVFNTGDVQFSQMMIVHHGQAVEMADLAATRASDPELKQLAAEIKAAQQPEIDTMAGWLKTWGQPTAMAGGHNMPGMDTMPGQMSAEDMNKLSTASGVDFDRMFARMMIAHHNGAIQMARDVQKNGTSAEVKRLAVQIEQAQTTEVGTLQAILDRL